MPEMNGELSDKIRWYDEMLIDPEKFNDAERIQRLCGLTVCDLAGVIINSDRIGYAEGSGIVHEGMMIASARAGTLYNMVMSRGMQGSDTEALNQGTPDFNGSGSNTPRGAFARLAYLNKLYVTGGTVNGSDEPKFYREASEILGNEAERGCFDDNAWRSRQNVLIRKLTLNINMRSMLLAGRVIITD